MAWSAAFLSSCSACKPRTVIICAFFGGNNSGHKWVRVICVGVCARGWGGRFPKKGLFHWLIICMWKKTSDGQISFRNQPLPAPLKIKFLDIIEISSWKRLNVVFRITHARSSALPSPSLITPHTFCIDLQITVCVNTWRWGLLFRLGAIVWMHDLGSLLYCTSAALQQSTRGCKSLQTTSWFPPGKQIIFRTLWSISIHSGNKKWSYGKK